MSDRPGDEVVVKAARDDEVASGLLKYFSAAGTTRLLCGSLAGGWLGVCVGSAFPRRWNGLVLVCDDV